MPEQYNGWTNYETWNVALWQDNEQGSYNYWRAAAQERYDEAEASSTLTREEQAAIDLADRLKAEYEDAMNEFLGERSASCVWAYLLGAALSEVNWHEIATNMMDEVNKDEDD